MTRGAPSWQDLANMQAFFESHAYLGIESAYNLALSEFPDIDTGDIRSCAESAIPEFSDSE